MKKIYKTIPVNGQVHVITNAESRPKGTKAEPYKDIADADYRGTGMALCGVCLPGESLPQWKQRANVN